MEWGSGRGDCGSESPEFGCSGPTGCSVAGCSRMGLGLVLVWETSSGVGQGKELAEVWLLVSLVSSGGGRVGSVCCMEMQIVQGIDEHLGDVVVLSERGAVV